jgi:hypothetical protein
MQIESQIYGAFTGWHGDALFKLTNGQFWLQAEYKYKYQYQYRPKVVIRKSARGYEMEVEGMEEAVGVRQVNVIESRIEGEFKGWSGDTTFQLRNGQVWQQSPLAYWYHYAYRPKVIVYESGGGPTLQLADDDSHAIKVRRVR